MKSVMLRVVLNVDKAAPRLVADQCCRKPGRGAWLHIDAECLEQAERRRGFARALRYTGSIETGDVRMAVKALLARSSSMTEVPRSNESGLEA